jgi:arsenate reductase (glutaredoxin)
MQIRIYHNPRCSKSREALALLTERGIQPEVILYLQDIPKESELVALMNMLDTPPSSLVRNKEDAYADSRLHAQSSPTEIAAAIHQAPILLERPIVVVNDRAVIARPPEKALSLL